MIVDSHCHLDRIDLSPYEGDMAKAVAAAREKDVGHILSVCVVLEEFSNILKIAESEPDITMSVGVHPTEEVPDEPTTEQLISLGRHPKVVAVGETGLDYYRTEGGDAWQQSRFRTHIEAANELDKPLIIHSRKAREDTISIMREMGADKCRGVMHCFTEDWAMAEKAIELGFYISISGIVTFKNAEELRDVARRVPLDRILIETDAPYLAPVPHRGKKNEPAFVRHVAEALAELRDLSYEEVAKITTDNFFTLFKDAKGVSHV